VSPFFLNLEEVLAIHEDRIRKYSGSSGPRDDLFHIRRKKIAAPPNELYDLVIGVAEGKTTKAAVAVFFQEHS
jgi:hypothetical protein